MFIKKNMFFLLFIFFPFLLFSKSTVCLNMIVKDEAHVIERALNSVKPLIDYWVIVDTGSTDGTQEIIKACMKGIPGELYERPWVNFAHNRNEALQLAEKKSDYLLFLDADEVLDFPSYFKLPLLDKDFYYVETNLSGLKYKRVQCISTKIPWHWEGVVHEALFSSEIKTSDTLTSITNFPKPEGNRSKDPLKFQKDAALLEEDLKKNPTNTRSVFYLAQSYKDASDYEKALLNYEKRAAMKGWDQEVFWSLFQAAYMQELLNKPYEEVVEAYKKASIYRPSRGEPLYRLAMYQRMKGNYQEAFETAKKGLLLPLSTDILFVENFVYDYGLLLEYSISAYWKELYLEAFLASNTLLSNPNLPDNVRECVEKNLVWIKEKLPFFSSLAKKSPLKRQSVITAAKTHTHCKI